MNLLLFTPKIFDYLEEKLIKFLETNKNDLSKCEFLIPDVVKDAIKEDRVEVDLLSTNAIWHGVTYKEDKEEVVKAIDELIEDTVLHSRLAQAGYERVKKLFVLPKEIEACRECYGRL